MNRTVRVVKVGGSLFDFPDLPSALTRWLVGQAPARPVLIAGAGKLADAIREVDALHQIGDASSHRFCLSLMTVTARLLARLVKGSRLIEDYDELIAGLTDESTVPLVFAAESFLGRREPLLPGAKVSQDWRSTSDTIAARLAHVLRAEELVLLKSTSLPRGASREVAAQRGLVDERFAAVAGALPIRWVNLRAVDQAEVWL